MWHYGRRLMEDGYKGGNIVDQAVDPDRLGYWCLLEHAKEKLRQKGNVKLFFRDPEKGRVRFRESLQLVHNDATTCQLLSVLNDKREVDVFVVCASSEDGVGGSCSYRKAEEKRPPNSHDNVIEDESLQNNEIGTGIEEELNDNELLNVVLNEENEEYEEYNEVGVEYLSDADDEELQRARENLKAMNLYGKKIQYGSVYRQCGLNNTSIGEGEARVENHENLNSVGEVEGKGKEGEKDKGKGKSLGQATSKKTGKNQ